MNILITCAWIAFLVGASVGFLVCGIVCFAASDLLSPPTQREAEDDNETFSSGPAPR